MWVGGFIPVDIRIEFEAQKKYQRFENVDYLIFFSTVYMTLSIISWQFILCIVWFFFDKTVEKSQKFKCCEIHKVLESLNTLKNSGQNDLDKSIPIFEAATYFSTIRLNTYFLSSVYFDWHGLSIPSYLTTDVLYLIINCYCMTL